MLREVAEDESPDPTDTTKTQDSQQENQGFRNSQSSSVRGFTAHEEAKGSLKDLGRQLKLFGAGLISQPIDPIVDEFGERKSGECHSEKNLWHWQEIGREFREAIYLSQIREERQDQEEYVSMDGSKAY
jgi:hypothetical protein